jgi:hypothetical protein
MVGTTQALSPLLISQDKQNVRSMVLLRTLLHFKSSRSENHSRDLVWASSSAGGADPTIEDKYRGDRIHLALCSMTPSMHFISQRL